MSWQGKKDKGYGQDTLDKRALGRISSAHVLDGAAVAILGPVLAGAPQVWIAERAVVRRPNEDARPRAAFLLAEAPQPPCQKAVVTPARCEERSRGIGCTSVIPLCAGKYIVVASFTPSRIGTSTLSSLMKSTPKRAMPPSCIIMATPRNALSRWVWVWVWVVGAKPPCVRLLPLCFICGLHEDSNASRGKPEPIAREEAAGQLHPCPVCVWSTSLWQARSRWHTQEGGLACVLRSQFGSQFEVKAKYRNVSQSTASLAHYTLLASQSRALIVHTPRGENSLQAFCVPAP